MGEQVRDRARIDERFDAAAAWVEGLCAERVLATAGQLYLWDAERALDVVIGSHPDGREVEPSDVAEVYCLTKPVVAAATVLALERVGVALDVPVRSLVPELTLLPASVTVPSIIDHAACLHAPSALTWILTPVGERPSLAAIAPAPAVARCYSEVSGWRVLVEVISRLVGGDVETWIDDEVLVPLGLAGEVHLGPTAIGDAARSGAVLVPIGGLPADAVPLLHIHAPGYRARCSPAFGGVASARALGSFAAGLADVRQGAVVEGLPSTASLRVVESAATPRAFDATWQRDAAFTMGYEVAPYRRYDGHVVDVWRLTGFLGASIVAVDVEANTGFALVLDGASVGRDEVGYCRDVVLGHLGYLGVAP